MTEPGTTEQKLTRKNKNILAVGLGLTFILGSNILGHVIPPFSIQVTIVLMPLIIGGINYNLYKENFTLTVIYGFVLLIINDLFIRFYAGGTHDQEGRGWILLYFSIAFVLSVICMIAHAFLTMPLPENRPEWPTIIKGILIVLISAAVTATVYWFFIVGI
jgi:hypothetical protein